MTKKGLLGLYLTILIFLSIFISTAAYSASYYVDFSQTGDNNTCSRANPCKRVPGTANFTGTPRLANGDTVYFKGGVTYQDQVGASQAMIPTIPGVTYTVDPTWGSGQATISGGSSGSYNEDIFWISGNGVTISGVDSRKLLKLTGYVANQAIAYVGQGSGTLSSGTIQYLEISVTNTTTGSSGIGIRIGDGADYRAITGGEVHHNEIHDCGGYGLKVSGGSPGVSGLSIHDNKIYECGGPASLDANVNISSDAGQVTLDFFNNEVYNPGRSDNIRINTPNVNIYNNQIYNALEDNIGLNPAYFASGTGTGKIYNNVISSAASEGIHIGATNSNQGYLIYNNLFVNNGTIGIYFESSVTVQYKILNNTIYCGSGQRAMKIWGSNRNIVIYNNILFTQNLERIYSDSTPSGNDVGYNVHYRADGGSSGNDWYLGSTQASTTNPLLENPSTVSRTAGDFRLTSSSPAKDTAQTRAEFSTDYFGVSRPQGSSWDRGFHEYSSSHVAPVADAGPSQTVTTGTSVTLDGSASTSPTGNTPLTYAWTMISRPGGSSATLSGSTTVHPTFTPDVAGDYTISLVVTDSLGSSSTNTAQVVIHATASQLAPIANAGPDQAVTTGTSVTLDGTGSSSPSGNYPLTYAWTLTRPSGSSASLSNSTTAHPTFTPDVAGDYSISLVVTDSRSTSSNPDSVVVHAYTSPSSCTVQENNLTFSGYATVAQDSSRTYAMGSFVPSSSQTLTRIDVSMFKVGNPLFNVQVKIYSDNNGAPGSLLGTSTTILSTSNIAADWEDKTVYTFLFSPGVSVSSNTKYWVGIYCSSPAMPVII